ncbi:uncharacterized protein LOC132061547 [Lycium ferocissimum]|uniref:uncharacterized protein LOC132061547 n=1 Tax=Lycium ferocissimum TaxID=112874 RepID=UPI0028165CD0|nr:uncharacterized protein LOC132061547 [Lycium ferocissimum]
MEQRGDNGTLSFYSSIKMAPFEALYGIRCRSPISWFEDSEAELLGPDLFYQAMEKAKVGQVAYELELAQELDVVHPVFHVSMLRKCVRDPSLVVPADTIMFTDGLTYEEIPMAILDRQVHKLITKEVALVKVLWRSHKVEEAT